MVTHSVQLVGRHWKRPETWLAEATPGPSALGDKTLHLPAKGIKMQQRPPVGAIIVSGNTKTKG